MEKAYPVIKKIAKDNRFKSFAYFQEEDVEQEIWVLCLEAMPRYDITRGPLEHFLRSHVFRRLKNLKRDKYYRPGRDMASSGAAWVQMNLINALPLYNVGADENIKALGCSRNDDPLDFIAAQDTYDYITQNLPSGLLDPFNQMITGHRIKNNIKTRIRELVIDMMIERNENGEFS